MRISDWSSDVCSSDLEIQVNDLLTDRFQSLEGFSVKEAGIKEAHVQRRGSVSQWRNDPVGGVELFYQPGIGGWKDRKRVLLGKSVSVLVFLGVRRLIITNIYPFIFFYFFFFFF